MDYCGTPITERSKTMKKVILVLTLLVSINTSCAHLDSSCAKALPVLAQGNALISEAQEALNQARVVVDLIKDESVRSKGIEAVETARSSLRVAASMLHASSQVCETPNIPTLFKTFAEAWDIVRTFITTFGGIGTGPVSDPKVYSIAKDAIVN